MRRMFPPLRSLAFSLALALLTAGCLSDDPPVTGLDCGEGQLVEIDGEDFCVYTGTIIEKGFSCPAGLHEYDLGSGVVCGGEDDFSPELVQDALEEVLGPLVCELPDGSMYPEGATFEDGSGASCTCGADGEVDCAGDEPDPDPDGDADGDEIADGDDNCPEIANPDQSDLDADGSGDACDADDDGDAVDDAVDNCPSVVNAEQADLDADGSGDACDDDDDGDGVADGADNCPAFANPDQADSNGNGVGDACEDDSDSDGIPDAQDNCPEVANTDQADLDADGIGDVCDPDDDDDGAGDTIDNCPLVANADQLDTDGDLFGDACDDDDDDDGVDDDADNCPLLVNPDQIDGDGNGVGDACEGGKVLVELYIADGAFEPIQVGETVPYTGICSYSDGSQSDCTSGVSWSTSDETVAIIGIDGHLTGVGPGTADVIGTLGEFTAYSFVEVAAPVVDIVWLNVDSDTFPAGGTTQVTANCVWSNGPETDCTEDVTWSSDNEAVAVVSNEAGTKGLVEGVASGSVSIEAQLDGFVTAIGLTITDSPIIEILLTPAEASASPGTTYQLGAACTHLNGTQSDCASVVTWSSSDSGIATVDAEGLVTALTPGVVVISADVGDISVQMTFTVTEIALVELEVSPSVANLAGGAPQQLSATCIYGDGSSSDCTGEATWTSSDPGVVSISATGLATAVSSGTVTITAELSGVTGTATLTASVDAITEVIVSGPTTLPSGLVAQFTATCVMNIGTSFDCTSDASWSSSNTGIALVSNAPGSHGLATGITPGFVTIAAEVAGVSGTASLEVTGSSLVELQVSPPASAVGAGLSTQLVATCVYSDLTTTDCTASAIWASNDTAVALVSNAGGSKGLVTGLSPGSATISAAIDDITGTATVTVTDADPIELQVSPATATVAAGQDLAFLATCVYSDGSVEDCTESATWASSDNSVAVVSNASGTNGLATGLSVGSATISASAVGITGSATLTVTAAELNGLEIAGSDTVAPGLTTQLTATCSYSDGTTEDCTSAVVWSTLGSGIAVIDDTGLVTGTSPGTEVVLANIAGLEASHTIFCATDTPTSIEVTPADASVAVGETLQFTAQATFTSGQVLDWTDSVTWSVSDLALADIDANGLLVALTAGEVEVTATSGGLSGSATLTVTPAAIAAIQLSPTSASLLTGTTQQFAATCLYTDGTSADCTSEATWVSSDNAVATVNQEGLATATGLGGATVTALVGDLSASATVAVAEFAFVDLALTPASVSIAAGMQVQLTATCVYSNGQELDCTAEATWTSDAPAVATVSNAPGSKGEVSALTSGSASISAAVGGLTGTATVTVTAGDDLVEIMLQPSSLSLSANSQQMTAVCVYGDGSSTDCTDDVTWTSSDVTVVSIDAGGLASGVASGTATITATWQGLSGTASVFVTIDTITDITLSPEVATVEVGQSVTFTATCHFNDGSTVDCTAAGTWSVSDEAVAVTSDVPEEAGVLWGLAAGVVTVSFDAYGLSATATLTVQ